MPVETPNDLAETLSDETLTARLDHLDAMLHEHGQKLDTLLAHLETATAFIEEHKGALAKGMSLLDPGAKMRDFLKGRHHGKD